MPGVPDVYQGTELWDLVPGRPGQPAAGRLRRAPTSCSPRIDAGGRPRVDADGAAKLLVTPRALRLRRDRPELFTGYTPLPADGLGGRPRWSRSTAAARSTVATRLPVGLDGAGGWRDTVLDAAASGGWTDVLTGRARPAADARARRRCCADYPVALLVREVGTSR